MLRTLPRPPLVVTAGSYWNSSSPYRWQGASSTEVAPGAPAFCLHGHCEQSATTINGISGHAFVGPDGSLGKKFGASRSGQAKRRDFSGPTCTTCETRSVRTEKYQFARGGSPSFPRDPRKGTGLSLAAALLIYRVDTQGVSRQAPALQAALCGLNRIAWLRLSFVSCELISAIAGPNCASKPFSRRQQTSIWPCIADFS